ncbi:hypothetical protein EXIGLDRAFT_752313 [Exidia glandulosa HHB12029]|uniref:F-box domain-containing protein n=1 Tax=Exidia glandulosa HHB12029 TaxID=1314781 RepID=A0A165EMH6_EXIGL|nr:hypothetical protein EXIGLDRAFT_752313 [Exidia glandulosa HHB12029]
MERVWTVRSVRRELVRLTWYLFLLFMSPLLLGGILCYCAILALYETLLCTQDYLSDSLRRARFGNNSRNAAVLLPIEIQLHIFHLLHQRGRFGFRYYDIYYHDGRRHTSARDLHSVALVCRGWNAAATEVLYYDVFLDLDRVCISFSDTLLRRPALARLVTRYTLPYEAAASIAWLTPESAMAKRRASTLLRGDLGSMTWLEIKSAIDRVVVMCTSAVEVRLRGDLAHPERIPGLIEASRTSRIRALSIFQAGPLYGIGPDRPLGPSPVPFPDPLLGNCQCFNHLTRLSLFHCDFNSEGTPRFPMLQTLELYHCYIWWAWLSDILQYSRDLHTLIWTETSVSDYPPGSYPLSLAQTCWAHEHRLTRCVFDTRLAYIGPMYGFVNLRTFECSATGLFTAEELPPQLETLIVTKVCGDYDVRLGTSRDLEARLLNFVSLIKHWLPYWKHYEAPSLSRIELWDTVDERIMPLWKVLAVLLNDFLTSWDVTLKINIVIA